MKVNLINELRVRYFREEDVEQQFTDRVLKAYPVTVDGNQLWVPKSVANKGTVVDKDTGEVLLTGYWVDEWWVRKNADRSKMLRKAPIDYTKGRIILKPNQLYIK